LFWSACGGRQRNKIVSFDGEFAGTKGLPRGSFYARFGSLKIPQLQSNHLKKRQGIPSFAPTGKKRVGKGEKTL